MSSLHWQYVYNIITCVISGFRREVAENCALLGYYAGSSGNFLQTFRDILWVPSSGVKNPVRYCHYPLRNIRRAQLLNIIPWHARTDGCHTFSWDSFSHFADCIGSVRLGYNARFSVRVKGHVCWCGSSIIRVDEFINSAAHVSSYPHTFLINVLCLKLPVSTKFHWRHLERNRSMHRAHIVIAKLLICGHVDVLKIGL
jgi:hypothetical protein